MEFAPFIKKVGPLSSFFKKWEADVVCFQETKVDSMELLEDELFHVPGYESFWSFCKVKRGYSGVVTYCKTNICTKAEAGFGIKKFDEEGRIMMTDMSSFVLFNIYTPNGGKGEERTKFKLDFYKAFQQKCEDLIESGRNVVVVGDLNTAHRAIDTHNPIETFSGFLPEERAWMDQFFAKGFVDTFRHFHKDKTESYTCWDQKKLLREVNKGWRLDYCIVDTKFVEKEILDSDILKDQEGSDHAPVLLKLKAQPPVPEHKIPELSSRVVRKKQSSISSFFKPASKSQNNEKIPSKDTILEIKTLKGTTQSEISNGNATEAKRKRSRSPESKQTNSQEENGKKNKEEKK